MKYHDIPEHGITIACVEDAQDDFYSLQSIQTLTHPYNDKKYVECIVGQGIYAAEKKTIILMENKDSLDVIVKCKLISVDTQNPCFLMNRVGQSIKLIYSPRHCSWFIDGTRATILNETEYQKWMDDPSICN